MFAARSDDRSRRRAGWRRRRRSQRSHLRSETFELMFDLCFAPGCQLRPCRAGTKGTSPAMAAVAPDDVQETVNALMHGARIREDSARYRRQVLRGDLQQEPPDGAPSPRRARVALSRPPRVHGQRAQSRRTWRRRRCSCATCTDTRASSAPPTAASRGATASGPRSEAPADGRRAEGSTCPGVAKHPDDASWRAWELHFLLRRHSSRCPPETSAWRGNHRGGLRAAAGDHGDADAGADPRLVPLAQLSELSRSARRARRIRAGSAGRTLMRR